MEAPDSDRKVARITKTDLGPFTGGGERPRRRCQQRRHVRQRQPQQWRPERAGQGRLHDQFLGGREGRDHARHQVQRSHGEHTSKCVVVVIPVAFELTFVPIKLPKNTSSLRLYPFLYWSSLFQRNCMALQVPDRFFIP